MVRRSRAIRTHRQEEGSQPRQDQVAGLAPAELAVSVGIQVGEPILVWGAPGEGKTSAIRAMAHRLDRHLEIVLGSIREPSDIGGIPMLDGDEVRLAPPSWAQRASVAPSVVLLDELTTCRPDVQAAMLSVVLERRVGELALPETTSIVAAANPAADLPSAWELSPPMANRFCHVEWGVDPRRWAQQIAQDRFATGTINLVPAERREHEQRWRGYVSSFIASHPDALFANPELDDRTRGWPSPRSWEMAMRLAAASDAAGHDRSIALLLVSGAVGEPSARMLWHHLIIGDLPDPEVVLADPDHAELPGRADATAAALDAIVSRIRADNSEDRWRRGWRILARVARESGIDVAATQARQLARLGDKRWEVPVEIELFADLVEAA